MRISEGHDYICASGARVHIAGRKKINNSKLWIYYGFQIDRQGQQISELMLWKSEGRDGTGNMHNDILREANLGMNLNDRCAVILERIIEAWETDLALPNRTAPKEFGNAMPDYIQDESTFAMEREEVSAGREDITRARHNAMNAIHARRARCTKERITRMDEAFGWLRAYLWDDEIRRVLLAYAEVKAKKWDWTRYIENRNRQHPRKTAWVKRTLYRWIEKSLQQIDVSLCKNGVILKGTDDLQMAHHEAESSCKSVTSTICAARGSDLIQARLLMESPASAA